MIAAPAVSPAAAEVMTWAWMSLMLPATHTPGTAVAPVRSASIRVPTTCSPSRTSAGFRPSGASSSARAVMRGATMTASSATRHPSDSRTPVRPRASASTCSTLPSVTAMPRASSCSRCSPAGAGPVCRSSVTCGLSCRNSSAWWTAIGPVARMPTRWPATSQPWQYAQCRTSMPHRAASPGTSGSSSRTPVATSSRRAATGRRPVSTRNHSPSWPSAVTRPVSTRPP